MECRSRSGDNAGHWIAKCNGNSDSLCQVSLDKAEETSLSYYLPIAGGRIIGFIPFPRVLVLCETTRLWSFSTTITTTPRAPPYGNSDSLCQVSLDMK